MGRDAKRKVSRAEPVESPQPLRLFRRIPAGWAFTAAALLIWVLVHRDYGITWDESVQSAYGEAVRAFFFGGRSFAEFSHLPGMPADIYFYGPALDFFCATIAHVFKADIFSVRHGVQGLLWVAMFYPACALGQRISGRMGAWCVGFALIGTPSLLGHAFNNPKDLPLACAAIWMLHVSVTVACARRLRWSDALRLGGAIGFVLAMRPGAWFLCAPLLLVPISHARRAREMSVNQRMRDALASTWPVLCSAAVIGWLLMVLPWPSAWHSPVLHPIKAAWFAMHFDGTRSVLFRGSALASNDLPWNYLAGYLVLTLPLPLLALAICGHVALWHRGFRSVPATAATLGIMFVLWFPMATFVLARPDVYDGMRHFLFMLPAVAVFAGIGAASVIQRLRVLPKNLVVPGTVAVLLSATPMMVRLHPYESVYYNVLAGARSTLHERYETDYWISSYREAALWINQIQSNASRPLVVAVAASDPGYDAFTHFLDPKVQVAIVSFVDLSHSPLPPEFDYYVATVRDNQWKNFPSAPIVHRIGRDGILLTVIREKPA